MVDRPDRHRTLPARAAPGRGSIVLPAHRVITGWIVLAVGLPIVTAVANSQRNELGLATELLVYLGVVVAAAAIGGVFPAIIGAVVAALLANFYLIEPIHTFTVNRVEHAIALVVFVAIAATVSGYVTVAARRAVDARRARAEAEALARATGTLVGSADPLPPMLDQLRATFGLDGLAVLRRSAGGWTLVAGSGDAPTTPDGRRALPIGDGDTVLVLHGPPLHADDEMILHSHADQVTLALAGRERALEAARLTTLEQIDQLRTAMLHAVSHDLRTPLTSIKTAITSLMASDVRWTPAETQEFLSTVDHQTDRLSRLVDNLLDMSRLEAGALSLQLEPVEVDDIVTSAIGTVASGGVPIEVHLPDDLPFVVADAALLERAVANIAANAVRYSPAGLPVTLSAAVRGAEVVLRVVDHGPGIPSAEREVVVRPFQRLGDRNVPNGAGVGLGLAIADGFARAMGGSLTLTETAGGGLTVEIALLADPAAGAQEDEAMTMERGR